jgi:hypothetical protein
LIRTITKEMKVYRKCLIISKGQNAISATLSDIAWIWNISFLK